MVQQIEEGFMKEVVVGGKSLVDQLACRSLRRIRFQSIKDLLFSRRRFNIERSES